MHITFMYKTFILLLLRTKLLFPDKMVLLFSEMKDLYHINQSEIYKVDFHLKGRKFYILFLR